MGYLNFTLYAYTLEHGVAQSGGRDEHDCRFPAEAGWRRGSRVSRRPALSRPPHRELRIHHRIFAVAQSGDGLGRDDINAAVLDQMIGDVDGDHLADDETIGFVL